MCTNVRQCHNFTDTNSVALVLAFLNNKVFSKTAVNASMKEMEKRENPGFLILSMLGPFRCYKMVLVLSS